MNQTCQHRSYRTSAYGAVCGATAKVLRDGVAYCRRHDPVARAERSRAQDEDARAHRAQSDALKRESEARMQALGMGSPHYAPGFGTKTGTYTGGVVLSPVEADRFIEMLREIRADKDSK
jgi:hypothetical protein